MTDFGQVAQWFGKKKSVVTTSWWFQVNEIFVNAEGGGSIPSLTAINKFANLNMSRITKAIATIDKAVSLGYMTEEMAFELKHFSFENSAEFEILYNLIMLLSRPNASTTLILTQLPLLWKNSQNFSGKIFGKNLQKIFGKYF